MFQKIRLISGLMVFLVLVPALSGAWVPVAAVKKVVVELAEIITRKGSTAIRELSEMGGEKALKEIAGEVAETGGEKALIQLQKLTAEHGVAGIRALKQNPVRMLNALHDVPESMMGRAIAAVNHNPATLNRLVTDYGSEALKVAVKHPGIGTDVAERLGRDGVAAALRLKTPQMIQLHRISPLLSQLAAAQQKPVMDMLTKAPERILSLLERHPNVLMTAAGVTVLINYRDALLGGSDLFQNPDGTWGVTSRPGMLERTVGKVLESEPVKTGIIQIFSVLGLIIFMRGLISMRAAVQRQRINQRNLNSSSVPPDENAANFL